MSTTITLRITIDDDDVDHARERLIDAQCAAEDTDLDVLICNILQSELDYESIDATVAIVETSGSPSGTAVLVEGPASDFTIRDEGSIVLFTSNTPAAQDWWEDHVSDGHTPPWGGATVVEHRYAEDIIAGLMAAGLTWDGVR